MAKLSGKEQQRRNEAEKMRKALEIVTVVVERQFLYKKRYIHTTTEDLCQFFAVKQHVMERIRLARIGEPRSRLMYGRISGKRSTHQATTRGCMLTVVHWIGRHGLGSVEQVMKRFHMERKDAERVLKEAYDQYLLNLAGTLYCEPEVYVATEEGLEATGLIYLSVSPLAARVEGHLRACVDAAIELELALGPGYKVLSEREVVALNRNKRGRNRLAGPYYYVIDNKVFKAPGFLDDLLKRLAEDGKHYSSENLRSDVDRILVALRAEGIQHYREGSLLEALDHNLVSEVDLLVHELAMKKIYKTPDLVVVREDGVCEEVIAVEIELTYKGAVFTAILNCYGGCTTIDRVEYRTSPTITDLVERDYRKLEQGADDDAPDEEPVDDGGVAEEGDLDGYEESALVEGWEVAEPHFDPPDEAGEEPEPEREPPSQDQPEGPRVPILIKEMAPEDVPALRRAPYYKPLPICSEAQELFRAASRNPKWHTDIKPGVLAHMEWICLNGMVTADALAVCFALPGGCEEAHESLLLAHGARWLYRTELLRAEDAIFFATEAGLREVGMDPKAWSVDYDYVAHYAVSGSTCMRTRVGAHLAQEFPHLVVKTRWELRVDGFFSGEGLMDVSKVTQFSGEHKYADLTLVDEDHPSAPYGIVLIYSYLVPLERVKAAMDAWLVHPRCGNLIVYIDDEKLRKAAKRYINEHEQSERVSVRALPISERERALRIKRSKALSEAAENERYSG